MTGRMFVLLLGIGVCGIPAQDYVNYEAPPCHPIRISADGSRLFTVNTADDRLTVWTLVDPSAPAVIAEISVGLRPISVTPRTNDEIWVVNWLSDTVSIVSLAAGRVVATLRVPDEPADVAFANGRAFVSSAASDLIRVFDVVSRQHVATIPVFGRDPRALVVGPAGNTVYALVQRSGNGTTILPKSLAPPPPPPTNPALAGAPQQGLIVRADDPLWSGALGYSVPDNDVAEIDATSLTVSRYVPAVGTNNFDIVVDAAGQRLFVANTNARNLVRFEPNLRGHAVDSRVTKVTLGPTPTVVAYDLNPGIDYNVLPNPAAAATALAEPVALALDELAGELFIAAHGTDRIAVTDLSGNVLARIDVALGSNGSRDKRGPRGLVLHASADRLYVMNRLSKTLSIIDTGARTVIDELAIASWDPEPAQVREGRRFLYDAKLSGNGTMSCSSCHVDSEMDGLAWDLGNPGGAMIPPPVILPTPLNLSVGVAHPMKGPMTTQTLRGIYEGGPLHWRGDRSAFADFNPAFDSPFGASQIPAADMNQFGGFATLMGFAPNPNQNLDRDLATTPAGANQQAGHDAFTSLTIAIGGAVEATCTTCHRIPGGTNQNLVEGVFVNQVQHMRVPHLRNLYRKRGFNRQAGQASKLGFGFTHDGSVDTLEHMLQGPQFVAWPNGVKDDLVAYLEVFDTGTAPLVGYQITVDDTTILAPDVAAEIERLRLRTAAGDIDLVVRGRLGGTESAWLYDPVAQTFAPDRSTLPALSFSGMLATVQPGDGLTFTGVTPNSGSRIAHDRDEDGVLDGDELAIVYGTATPGSFGPVTIGLTSEARIGNPSISLVTKGAPPNGLGVIAFARNPTSVPLGGITLLVDLFDPLYPGILIDVQADGAGCFAFPAPIPDAPSMVGASIRIQAVWGDPGVATGLSASAGLHVTVRP